MAKKSGTFPGGNYYLIFPKKIRNVATVALINYYSGSGRNFLGGGISIRIIRVKLKELNKLKLAFSDGGFIPLNYKDAGENELEFIRITSEETDFRCSHDSLDKGKRFATREDFFRMLVHDAKRNQEFRKDSAINNPEVMALLDKISNS
jgi:hypothetical protein